METDRIVVLISFTPRWSFFEEVSGHRSLFEDVSAYTLRAANLSGHGPAERVLTARVSAGFLRMIGVRPVAVGVRLALGASRTAVLWSLAGRGAKQVAVGLELGVLITVSTVTSLRAWLLGAQEPDVSTGVSALVLVAVVSAVALLTPAWRATAVDPVEHFGPSDVS